MPCDDKRTNTNLIEYVRVLNDIDIICNSVDVNVVCLGGDINTDLSRGSYQTKELIQFVNDNLFNLCVNDPCSTVEFTFCSKGRGNQLLIDHFILSENATELLLSYDDVDGANNFSDHSAVKCVINNNMQYFVQNDAKKGRQKTAWHTANEMDIKIYLERVDHYI